MEHSLRKPMIRFFLALSLLGAQSLWALTGGPSQPEYAGFTPSTKSGSVDLYSGDFSYSIPLMTVPGPSFNYPITLGYRAGITTDQASSWVGLGWSLNAGAINRALNKYPDDYWNGRSINELSGSNSVHAWEAGVGYMGIGLTVGQRSDHGWHGGLNFSLAGYDIGGLKFDQTDGFGMREMTSLTDQFVGKASGAALSALNGGANSLLGTQQIGLSVSPSSGGSNVSVAGVGFGSSSVSSGAFNNKTFGVSIPVLNTGVTIDFSTSRSWLHKKETDKLFGYLNLGDFPKETQQGQNPFVTKNVRMEYNFSPDDPLVQKEGNSQQAWLFDMFFRQKAFATSTPDGYQAKAEGVSLSFRPYRQDIGEYFGADRLEAEVGFWMGVINKTWLAYIPIFERRTEDQKERYNSYVGFEATQFVRQANHADQASGYFTNYQSATHQYPVVGFRETGSTGGAFLAETWRPRNTGTRCGDWRCEMEFRRRTNGISTATANDYLDPEIQKTASGAPYPDRISGGSGVFPLYKNGYSMTGVIGLEPGCGGVADDNNPRCSPDVPDKALIGFTVVRPDGMIYEYHKPAFNWIQKNSSVTRPADENQEGAYDFGDITQTSSMSRAYATSWLLTAIKAPDYVDLAPSGIGDNDIGSWVSFTYGKRVKTFHWRTPYAGTNPMGIGKDQDIKDQKQAGGPVLTLNFKSYGQASWGAKEVYFMTEIRTPSHAAKFAISTKRDNDGLESEARDVGKAVSNTEIMTEAFAPEENDQVTLTYFQGTPVSGGCTKNSGTKVVNAVHQITELNTNPASPDFTQPNENGRFGALRMKVTPALLGSCPDKVTITRARRTGEDYALWQLNNITLEKRGATPIVMNQVRFGYDGTATNELSPGIPNTHSSGRGKLTLRTVTLSDGNGSDLPPYRFKYQMEGNRAPYSRLAFDRWGYYKSGGGRTNTTLLKGHVMDWDYFHNLLKTTTASDQKTVFENAVSLELDAGDLAALKAAANAAAIRPGYYQAMVRALNRIRGDLTFYQSRKASWQWPTTDGLWSHKWRSLAQSRGVLNGSFDVVAPSAADLHYLQGLQAALMAEQFFKNGANQTIFRDLASNRHDHEPNPDEVKAWSLKQVTLPSGGKIDVEYESDDFAYVGRSRAVDLVDVDLFRQNGNLDYFRNIGQDKTLLGNTNMLRFNEAQLGDQYWKNPSKVKIRVSSLFRIYKQDANGAWQINPTFAKLRANPATRLHLLAFYNDMRVTDNILSGSNCGTVSLKASTYTGDVSSMGIQSPFMLGSLANTLDIRDPATAGASWMASNQCQRGYVEFDLSQLNLSNLEAGNKLTTTNCNNVSSTSDPAVQQKFLKELGYLTLSWGRPRNPSDPTDWPLFIPIERDPTMDGPYAKYSRFVHLDPRATPVTNPVSDRNLYPTGTLPGPNRLLTTVLNDRPDTFMGITFQEGGVWKGPGRWDMLSELSFTDASDSWEVMSYNSAVRIAGGDPVSMGAGIAGGGLRVKRLSYNTGWPQRKGDAPQAHVTEYAYDCSGANGGVYSSGSTATLPPPYNNRGDDRVDQQPQAALVEGSPFVGYRRVTEIRPGRGRIVYDFLAPADIADYIAYDNCNGGNIVDGVYLGMQPGCYNKDAVSDWRFTGHARWKLNRVSHFQGLMIGKTKYSQRKPGGTFDLVAEEKYRYMTSLNPSEIGDIAMVTLLNNSDATGITALYSSSESSPTNKLHFLNRMFAGSRDYPFTDHPTSEHMGKTIERLRLRSYFREQASLSDPRANMGLNEMEIVEHSVRQWEIDSKVEGVGTRKAHSYFDFVTGEPMVTTEMALKRETVNGEEVEKIDDALPAKTSVTVPAHWVRDFNPNSAPTGDNPSMGSIYNDPNFLAFSTGTAVPGMQNSFPIAAKNMLSQSFSQSTYVGLGDYRDRTARYQNNCPAPCPDWSVTLDKTNILSRNLTTWKPFSQAGTTRKAWRVDESFSLRLPMADKGNVKVERGSVMPPLPLGADNVGMYRTNAAYVLTSQNLQYGDLGEVLEDRDAYDSRTASFYMGNKLLVGQVVNSDRASCAVLSMDELSAVGSLSPVWTVTGSAALATDAARSGTKSMKLTATNDRLTMTLPSVRNNRSYEFTYWAKDPGRRGFLTLRVNGAQAAIFGSQYDVAGPEWQKVRLRIFLSVSLPTTVQVTAEVLLEPGANSGMWIDDARFVAEDAQAYTMTYDEKGNRSSQAGPNDMLTRYQYDAFGKLVEVQDHQGVTVSTQAELEAK